MNWPEDTFDDIVKQQDKSMYEYGLRLYSVKEYSEKESGLNKLLFDSPNVTCKYKQFEEKITNIEFYLRKHVIGIQIDEEYYNRVIIPVWMIKGLINEEAGKTITGVIRPRILDSGLIIKPISTLSPEFHFYINTKEGTLQGKSIEEYGPYKLMCSIASCKLKDLNEINPYFCADTSFGRMCKFYVE